MDELRERVEHLHSVYLPLYEGDPGPKGASEEQIAKLLEFAGPNVPKDYLDFLCLSNGLIELHNIDTVIERSQQWQMIWPGGLFIGDDSGEGTFIIHMEDNNPSDMPVVYFPDEDVVWHNDVREWPTFTEFFLEMFPLNLFDP